MQTLWVSFFDAEERICGREAPLEDGTLCYVSSFSASFDQAFQPIWVGEIRQIRENGIELVLG